MRNRIILPALLLLLSVSPVSAASRLRVRIPINTPRKLALQLLTEAILGHADALEANMKADGKEIRIHPPKEGSLSIKVPVTVKLTESQSDTVLGVTVPYSKIQVEVEVRCACDVSYDLSEIRIGKDELVFPEPKVIGVYLDPPGERGKWKSSAAFFRSRESASIDALREKLINQAPEEAKKKYLHESHHVYEEKLQKKLTTALQDLIESRKRAMGGAHAQGFSSGAARPTIPSWITISGSVAILLGVVIVSVVNQNWKKFFYFFRR